MWYVDLTKHTEGPMLNGKNEIICHDQQHAKMQNNLW